MGGGGGTTTSGPDPAVGEAAKMNATTAAEQLAWTKQYFNDVLTPLQQSAERRADTAAEQQTAEYEANRARTQLQDERYRQYGIPAEDRYYRMVDQYSEPEEAERQARAAQADVTMASGIQQGVLRRQLASQGIDPTSPAAIAAQSDAAVMTAAQRAGASNAARSAARTLGMALTSDAANFGRGTGSAIAAFSQLASGNANSAAAAGQQGLANGLNVGGFVQGGYANANRAYGQNLSSLTSDASSRLNAGTQLEAANAAGMGSAAGAGIGLVGMLGSAAIIA